MISLAITGEPGVGKTTLLMRLLNMIRSEGIHVYGFFCPEVREEGKRIGFKIIDIATGAEGWLALTPEKARSLGYNTSMYRKFVGRYIVIEDEAERIGVAALSSAKEGFLAIDEIGPMELAVEKLRKAIIHALVSASNFIVVVHRNMKDSEILKILREKNTQWVIITRENRDSVYHELASRVRNEILTFKQLNT